MDWKANNWDDHAWLRRKVIWSTGGTSPGELCAAVVDGKAWVIRLNDFPAEPLYTLLVDGAVVIHFDDWPAWPGCWGRQPRLSRADSSGS